MIAARALLLILALPAASHAFSDASLYEVPAIEGGGGGRLFTGSRVDGYACSVCHGEAPATDFTIDPLPDHLERGRRYDLVIRWAHPELPHALHLELANPDGSHPDVTLPAMPPPASRCGQATDGTPATYAVDVGIRRVIGVEPCGAAMVTASFVATGERIELAVAAVRGDGSETAEGDATFERHLTFDAPPPGGGGCRTSDQPGLVVAVASLAMLLTARSRRAR